jgi:hypothetical protein
VTDPGWRIESISGNTSDTYTYTDTDHENDSFEIGSGGPVKRFVYVGDTELSPARCQWPLEMSLN